MHFVENPGNCAETLFLPRRMQRPKEATKQATRENNQVVKYLSTNEKRHSCTSGSEGTVDQSNLVEEVLQVSH